MEMKGALTNAGRGDPEIRGPGEENNLKEHFYCGLRKSEPRIPVAVCHKQRCLFLESDGGKFRCNYRNYVDRSPAPARYRARYRARKRGQKNASK